MEACYTYDADVHCFKCTMDYARKVPYKDWLFTEHYDDADYTQPPGIFNLTALIQDEIIPDSENNPIRSYPPDEEWWANDIYEGNTSAKLVCGSCGVVLDTWEAT